MSSMADELRKRAEQLREGSNTLLGANDLATNATKQIAAIVGQVNAGTLEALADVVDYLRGVVSVDEVQERRRTVMELNDGIRRAAARGDWEEFDRLVAEISADTGGGSEEQPPGTA